MDLNKDTKVDDLKAHLIEQEIEFDPKAKKPELQELAGIDVEAELKAEADAKAKADQEAKDKAEADAKANKSKGGKKVGRDKFNKTEIEAMAKDCFKRLKKTKELFACEDGQMFFVENDARLHAKARGLSFSKITK